MAVGIATMLIRRVMHSPIRTLLPFAIVALFVVMHLFNVWPLNRSETRSLNVQSTRHKLQPKYLVPLPSEISPKKHLNIPNEIPGGKKIYIGDQVYYDHGEELDDNGIKTGAYDNEKLDHQKNKIEEKLEMDINNDIKVKIEETPNKATDDERNRETENEHNIDSAKDLIKLGHKTIEGENLKEKWKDEKHGNKEKDSIRVKNLAKVPGQNLFKFASKDDIPNVHVTEANCANLFEHHPVDLAAAKTYQAVHPKIPIPDVNYTHMAQDCDKFTKERKYIMKPVNEEEESFPIAFSILLFKDVEMVERLLRAVYRPQNYYCIHVDSKSNKEVHDAMKAIVNCFDNVFLAHRSVDVQWAWYSVLEPDIVCMEDLMKRSSKWKYFINLTGQEFPLKTNLDLVKILKVFNGANSMEGTIKRYSILVIA